MGYGGEGDVDQMVDRAQAEVYDVTDRRTSEDYLPLRDLMDGALTEIEAISNRGGEMVGVPTGFAELDMAAELVRAGFDQGSSFARYEQTGPASYFFFGGRKPR